MSLVRFRSKQPVGNIWDDFFNRDFIDSSIGRLGNGNSPAVNVAESNDGFTIEVAAPGYEKADFNVFVDNGTLTVSSEKKLEEKESAESYTRREFMYSTFKRSFTLPDSVEAGKVSASYENGILKINVPKREEAKAQPARTIAIK